MADVKLLAREISVDRPMSPQQAANLFNQQLWCWGRDIEASKGNLLVRHGFQRIEKPRGSSASSIYRLESSPTSRVILRGFGVFFGDDRWGGLFLPRFEFKPQLSPEPDLTRPAWSTEDLPPLTSPRADQLALCQNLLLSLIDWIRRYELWIAEHVGTAYRNRTLIPWKTNHESVVPAEETAAAWELLGVTIEERPEHFIRCLESRSESAA
ncbi:MAG: hypothetical protein ACYTGL_19255 [Planctomycetota bacterium]